MPNKNVESAIAKGTGQLEGVSFEEVTFEGYAPGGVAVLVESMTDNRNRTVAEVRHVFTKVGGNLGAANSVNWMFKSKGMIRVPKERADEETLMEIVLEAGAEDLVLDGDAFEITTEPSAFENVRAALDKVGIKPESAELSKIPENAVSVDGETAAKVLRLVEALDELDDTQRVYSNFDVGDADLKALGEGK
jgi:YebC/PmpR family DNA-binding regulatory protein